MGVRQSRNGYTSTPRNLPNLANFNIEGNVKVLLLGTGEGGKATIFKQMVHQYGTKRRVDQTISELEDEHFLNSYQSVEVRKSFIPIIHRNCILAMYNLVYGAINTFQLPVNMTPNTPTKEAVDIIFSEREHAISFEDWSLTARIGKTISYLWNNEPCIQEAYHRRNELELEYMESAKYWFQEIDRIVEPNYLPKMDDIFRMRVKTTGIVETDLHVPIKVRRRQEDSYNNITMDDMSSDKMLYKRASLVLMGSQRNERKKWIHAFLEASAVVFVVALSEYNQLLYEDGRTNRLKESLVLFSEIVNSSYFEGVPIYLFLNKHDVFMERIQTSDLSNVFPDLPDDLRLDSLPIKNFVPQIIQQKLTQVNEQWAQQAQSHKLMDELANYEKQRIAVLSDDEAEPQDHQHQQQGTNNRKKEKKKHHLSRRARLIRRLTRGKSQKHTVSGLGRKKSSLLFDRIELASRASDSSFKSVASFNDTLHDEGDDEEDEEEEDDPTSSTSSDTTTITSTTNNHTTEEFFLPDDVILYTFMFLEPKDLVEVNLVCYDFYMIAESDILWRTMCLRYQSDLQEEAVLQVYAKQSDTDSPQQQQQQQQPFNLIQITSPSLVSDGVMDVTKSPPDYSRIVKTGPYKHYYQFGEQFVRRNVLYITNQFLSLTPRRDIKVEVTCAIDMISFKPIMERVLAGILKEVASSSRK